MSAMASQITSVLMVSSIVCSGSDQRKHQGSASLAFARGIHRSPVNSPHKGPITRKMFPFDGVIIVLLCLVLLWSHHLLMVYSCDVLPIFTYARVSHSYGLIYSPLVLHERSVTIKCRVGHHVKSKLCVCTHAGAINTLHNMASVKIKLCLEPIAYWYNGKPQHSIQRKHNIRGRGSTSVKMLTEIMMSYLPNVEKSWKSAPINLCSPNLSLLWFSCTIINGEKSTSETNAESVIKWSATLTNYVALIKRKYASTCIC